jgi:hypothetical protein
MFQSNEWWFGAQLHHTAQIVMHWRIKGYDPLPLFLSTTIFLFFKLKKGLSPFSVEWKLIDTKLN